MVRPEREGTCSNRPLVSALDFFFSNQTTTTIFRNFQMLMDFVYRTLAKCCLEATHGRSLRVRKGRAGGERSNRILHVSPCGAGSVLVIAEEAEDRHADAQKRLREPPPRGRHKPSPITYLFFFYSFARHVCCYC